MGESDGNFGRVILWTTPRCTSTVFERSIRALGNIKVFHELFGVAAYLGEERFFPHYQNEPVKPGYKFGDVKHLLEETYEGYRGVFMKDHAYRIIGTGRTGALPDGCRHSFLIRKPIKSVTSFYKAFTAALGGEAKFLPDEAGFCAMWELYQYIRDVKAQTPVVIDADDLLGDPATMMKKYCDAVGFEFKEEMLRWEPGRCEGWLWEDSWYTDVISSTAFFKPAHTSPEVDVSSFPQYVQDAIQASQPSYDELYKLRIQP